MNALVNLAANHPVFFCLGVAVTCFVILLLLTGLALSKLPKPYGDLAAAAMRLTLTAVLLWLIWRLGGLEASGLTRLGRWQTWAFALAGLLTFCCAGLYAFYGKVAFDVTHLVRSPEARTVIWTQLATVIHEEVLYRGVVLFVLYSAWGHTGTGTIGSVVLTAVLFAIPHLMSVFMGVSLPATLLLVTETCIIAVWWGALVLWGQSIWPAVVLHYVVNVVIAVQGLTAPMVTPDTLAYRRLLLFSIPLGVLGVALLTRM